MACVQILTHLINTSISHIFLIGSPRLGFSRSRRHEGSISAKGLLDLTVQLLTHWVGESKLRASLYFISDHKAGEFWWLELLCLHSAFKNAPKGVKKWQVEGESYLLGEETQSLVIFGMLILSLLLHWVTFSQIIEFLEGWLFFASWLACRHCKLHAYMQLFVQQKTYHQSL